MKTSIFLSSLALVQSKKQLLSDARLILDVIEKIYKDY